MVFGDSRFESSEFRRNRSGLDGMELLPDLFIWLEFNCEIAKCVSTVLDGDDFLGDLPARPEGYDDGRTLLGVMSLLVAIFSMGDGND